MHLLARYLRVLLGAALLTVPVGAVAQQVLELDPSIAVTQYPRQVWSGDNGLPQSSATAIAQTPDGFIWVGTQDGLARLDGVEMTVFDKYNDNILKNTVSSLYVSPTGDLWIGSWEGGVTRYDGTDFENPEALAEISDVTVNAITGSLTGDMWFGTRDGGLFRYRDGKLDHFTVENGLPSNNVTALMVDRDGQLWIGTKDHGYAVYDGQLFSAHGSNIPDLKATTVKAIVQSAHGDVLLGTDAGLFRLKDGTSRSIQRVEGFPHLEVLSLVEDNVGTLWAGTADDGLYRITDSGISSLSVENEFIYNKINAVFQDREGSLWVGTDGGGLCRIGPAKFLIYSRLEGLSHNTVWPVYGDDNGVLWIGTEGGGVNRLKDGKFTNFTVKDGLAGNDVRSISGQRDGSVWFGTTEGLSRYKDGVIETFSPKDGLKEDAIPLLYTDSRDRLWIGYFYGGLQWYANGKFHWFTGPEDEDKDHVGLSSNIVSVMMEGANGDLWVGTFNAGLNRIFGDKVVDKYTRDNGLQSDYVTALYQDVVGIVWIGTRDGGLHRLEGDKITSITTKDGLHNNTVQHIVADGQGNLWMTSNQGLFRVSRHELNEFAQGKRKEVTSVSYDLSDGLLSNEFNGGVQPAGWKSIDGRLWFPSNKGLVSIDPAHIPVNEIPPKVVVESVTADGAPVRDGDTLPPGVKRLEFRYAAPSFIAPQRVRYEYMLEGVDDDWQRAGGSRVASYTNIGPGPYKFRLRAANSDGVWSETEEVFSFSMRPFFYQTIWFLLCCALVVGVAAFTIYRLRVNRLKLRQKELEGIVEERTRDLREEKEKTETALRATEIARRDAERQKEIAQQAKNVIEAQAEQLREMDRIKSRFFGNISHEFRTPLTLTIGPLENALTGVYGPVSQQLGSQLEVMLRNSRRLLRLINQLLDLSKLESGKFKLKPRKGELVNLTEGVVMSFTAFAEKEGIQLSFDTRSPSVELWYDGEAVEKVLFNLISNAVKFTPEGGSIDVSLQEVRTVIRGASYEAVEIKVRDSGSGIPATDLPYIFDRFHQVDGTVSRVQEGTGIGLSLVKELVDLHGGTIRVESAVGEGTEFAVLLPKGTDHFDKSDLQEGDADDDYEISHGPMVEMAVFDDSDRYGNVGPSDGTELTQTVLVVDDSRDIRDYVVSCLQNQYKIVTAKDGLDGLEKLSEASPDLIISDVMMPRMDGYAFCRAIKKDPDHKHIPVILLTSKASLEAKIEGLEAGSDDYLAKPFNATELRVRIKNLLRLRHQANELKGLNDELVETNDALREASELKSQLLNIASHDMKNPLTAIREFARIIRDEIGKDSHLDELLELIYSSSNEMLQLVTQLLDSAALESGKLSLNMRPVNVSSLAEIVVHRNMNQAKLKGQKISLDVVGDPEAMVSADFDRLQEAMDNLISNAIKYSPLDKPIDITVRTVDSVVRFEVKDYGPGLSDDDMSKLFGKFVKLSAQPTGGESSTGLGLSIVKQIIELHGGDVFAQSVLGEGSTFVIELSALSEEQVMG